MKQRYFDLSRHGLYLYDFYITCENFGLPFFVPNGRIPSETFARALFILDKHGVIDENRHEKMFFRLWRCTAGVVYLVKTNVPGYEPGILNALDIISFLGLNGNITSNIFDRDDMNAAFLDALSHDKQRFFQHLFKSKYLGINKNGEKVLASYFGRFIFNKTTKTSDLLYKVSASYYYREVDILKQYAIYHDIDFNRLSKILVANPNAVRILTDDAIIDLCGIMMQSHYLTEVSDADRSNITSMQSYVLACLLFDLLPATTILSRRTFRSAFLQCQNFESTRRLENFTHLGMPTLPMTMCVSILALLGTNKKISAAQVNMPLLAIIRSGQAVIFGHRMPATQFIERYHHDLKLVGGIDDLDSQKNPNQLAIFTPSYKVQQHQVKYQFDGRDVYSYTFTHDHHARLLKFLEKRHNQGKSVFLIPCLNFGILGYDDETELIRWLAANYLHVDVIDIDKSLFYHDVEPRHWRLLIIGDKRSPGTANLTEYETLTARIFPDNSTIMVMNYKSLYEIVITKIIAVEQAIATATDEPPQSTNTDDAVSENTPNNAVVAAAEASNTPTLTKTDATDKDSIDSSSQQNQLTSHPVVIANDDDLPSSSEPHIDTVADEDDAESVGDTPLDTIEDEKPKREDTLSNNTQDKELEYDDENVEDYDDSCPVQQTNLTKNDDDDDDDDDGTDEPEYHSDDIDSKSDSDDSGVEKEPSNEELESIESALHQELLNSSEGQGGF